MVPPYIRGDKVGLQGCVRPSELSLSLAACVQGQRMSEGVAAAERRPGCGPVLSQSMTFHHSCHQALNKRHIKSRTQRKRWRGVDGPRHSCCIRSLDEVSAPEHGQSGQYECSSRVAIQYRGGVRPRLAGKTFDTNTDTMPTCCSFSFCFFQHFQTVLYCFHPSL